MSAFNKYYLVDVAALVFSVVGLILACFGVSYAGMALGTVGLTGGIVSRVFVKKWRVNEWYARIVLTVIAFLFFATCVTFGVFTALEYIDSKQLDPA